MITTAAQREHAVHDWCKQHRSEALTCPGGTSRVLAALATACVIDVPHVRRVIRMAICAQKLAVLPSVVSGSDVHHTAFAVWVR